MQELKFIGIGGGTCVELGGNSAYIKQGDKLLLIDCCDGCAEKLLSRKILTNDIKEILIIITHTHADHVAGLGNLIWQTDIIFGVKPKILSNSPSFKETLVKLLDILGVGRDHYDFIEKVSCGYGFKIEMMLTTHEEDMECYSVLFEDKDKVFYSSDTNDIETIYKMAKDSSVKRIYCEVYVGDRPEHITYEELKKVSNKDKFVLMHFNTKQAYERIKNEKLFKVAKIEQ